MIIVPIMLRMYGMGIYGPGWPSTINNSALTSIILHIMSIFTITGSYKYCCTVSTVEFNYTSSRNPRPPYSRGYNLKIDRPPMSEKIIKTSYESPMTL